MKVVDFRKWRRILESGRDTIKFNFFLKTCKANKYVVINNLNVLF